MKHLALMLLVFHTSSSLAMDRLDPVGTPSPRVVVETPLGPVEGSRVETVDPRTNLSLSYTQYTMIPFAAPPLGELRFRPPAPPQPWTEPPKVPFTRVCYQVTLLYLDTPTHDDDGHNNLPHRQLGDGFDLVPDLDTDEDCLYLR